MKEFITEKMAGDFVFYDELGQSESKGYEKENSES